MFEIAAGSVRGRDHTLSGKNNQDSFHIIREPGLTVAVVCDGCGDPKSPHSEVGAYLGAKMVAGNLAWSYSSCRMHLSERKVWDNAKHGILNDLRGVIDFVASYETERQRILDAFLFTVIGIIITDTASSVFTIGDGVAYVNGDKVPIPPYPNNAPPYIAYNLLDSSVPSPDFFIRSIISTSRLQSFAIASDGALDLELNTDTERSGKPIGSLAQFWTDDVYYEDANAINRRLAMIGRESQRIDWDNRKVDKLNSVLHDDTTIIAGRRKQ
jgi:hypothetical protein